MTTKFFHPKQHLGYSTKLSIAENVSRGHRCALERHEKEPYLVTAHELEALANVSEHSAPKSSRTLPCCCRLRLHASRYEGEKMSETKIIKNGSNYPGANPKYFTKAEYNAMYRRESR